MYQQLADSCNGEEVSRKRENTLTLNSLQPLGLCKKQGIRTLRLIKTFDFSVKSFKCLHFFLW